MLYTEEAVRANIRNREGKRVFYLGKGDTLTPGARDWQSRQSRRNTGWQTGRCSGKSRST